MPVPVPVPSTTGGTNVAVTVITPVPVLVGKTEPMLGGTAVRTPVTKLGVNVGREVTVAGPAVIIPVSKLGVSEGRRVTVAVTVQMAVGIHCSGGGFMPVAVPVPGRKRCRTNARGQYRTRAECPCSRTSSRGCALPRQS